MSTLKMSHLFLSYVDTQVVMRAVISCRLDYCNVLLFGLPKKTIFKLHVPQNSAAHVLTRTRGQDHITTVFKNAVLVPRAIHEQF